LGENVYQIYAYDIVSVSSVKTSAGTAAFLPWGYLKIYLYIYRATLL